VRHGRTLGGPVAIRIANTEWPKWETVMSPDPVDQATLDGQARNAPLASARETAARVALGEVARRLLSQVLGVEILSHVVAIGQVRTPDDLMPGPGPSDAATIDAEDRKSTRLNSSHGYT